MVYIFPLRWLLCFGLRIIWKFSVDFSDVNTTFILLTAYSHIHWLVTLLFVSWGTLCGLALHHMQLIQNIDGWFMLMLVTAVFITTLAFDGYDYKPKKICC